MSVGKSKILISRTCQKKQTINQVNAAVKNSFLTNKTWVPLPNFVFINLRTAHPYTINFINSKKSLKNENTSNSQHPIA